MRLLKLLPLLVSVTTLSACAGESFSYSYNTDTYSRPIYVNPYPYNGGYYDRWGVYHPAPGRVYYYDYAPPRVYYYGYGPRHWHRDHYWRGDSYSPSKDPRRGSAITPFGATQGDE